MSLGDDESEGCLLVSARSVEKEPREMEGESRVALLLELDCGSNTIGAAGGAAGILGDAIGEMNGEDVGDWVGEGRDILREAVLMIGELTIKDGEEAVTGRDGGVLEAVRGPRKERELGRQGELGPRGIRLVATVRCSSGFSVNLSWSSALAAALKSRDEELDDFTNL